jgi:hypothetical protein
LHLAFLTTNQPVARKSVVTGDLKSDTSVGGRIAELVEELSADVIDGGEGEVSRHSIRGQGHHEGSGLVVKGSDG